MCFPANPLLINSSLQPDLTVSRTYTSPMCFQDSIDKELMAERSLLDPLPDLKVKGQEIKLLWKPVSVVVSYLWTYRDVYSSAVAGRGISLLDLTCFPPEAVTKKALIQRKITVMTLEGITNWPFVKPHPAWLLLLHLSSSLLCHVHFAATTVSDVQLLHLW